MTVVFFATLHRVRGQSLLAGLVVVTAVAIGGADYWFKERLRPTEMPDDGMIIEQPQENGYTVQVPESGSTATIAIASSDGFSSSGKKVVKKGTSTKKISVNVDDVFVALGLTSQQTSEASLLMLTTQDATVKTVVLLRNNDRAFLFSWIESDDVKTIFSAVKQALQEQFSGKVTDLTDETRTPDTGPPVDILSFIDPAISKEKIVFLRVRNRLYEIHVAENGTEVVGQLVEALSK